MIERVALTVLYTGLFAVLISWFYLEAVHPLPGHGAGAPIWAFLTLAVLGGWGVLMNMIWRS